MGDVLPPKRQTVVERIKRRFELYRRHQNACLPRYEQSASGLYEAQRQETLLLKKRFLESKAKKAKNSKSDHHRTYKESLTDGQKSQLHIKPLKRPAEEAIANTVTECTNEDEKPAKITRTETASEKTASSAVATSNLQSQTPAQPPLPSFSVQIVQQFSKAPHGQQTQTIQTNVTVQTLSKPLNSPAPQCGAANQQVQESASNPKDVIDSTPSVEDIVATSNNIECKQEKESVQSDLCQFKHNQTSNSSGGDRLSDTFPSIGFTDDSGDDVIHPDILKDLIDDVFTNSADIMKDFNFEDSVGSMKDQEDTAKDIIDLMKSSSPTQIRPFQSDNLSFSNAQTNQHQQNGIFRSISTRSEAPMPAMSTASPAPVTTTSSFYTSSQRLPSYVNSALSLPSGLSLDFKLSEPSPAALTLKQMAEQHQNMQQKQQHQQMVTSPLTSRPSSFNQDNYAAHMNNLRSAGYLNNSNPAIPNNSPKASNSSTNIFNSFERSMATYPGTESINPYPGNCEAVKPNHMFKADMLSRNSSLSDSDRSKQQRLQMENACQQMEQQKPPAYGATRPLTHYSDGTSIRHQNPMNNQHHQRPLGRQFQSNAEIRFQMPQSHHVHSGQHNSQQLQQGSHDLKQPQQQHNVMQPHSNLYGTYTPQQPVNNPAFHVSMSQSLSYPSQFNSSSPVNRPPPEYKAHHPNMTSDNLHLSDQLNAPSQILFNHPSKSKYVKQQRPPNVTITPEGSAISSSGEWRHGMVNQQHNQFRMGPFPHQDNYGDIMRSEHVNTSVPTSSMYNQYRMHGNPIPGNRAPRPSIIPTNHMLVQLRQRALAPQQARNIAMNDMEQHSAITINSNNTLSSATVMGPVYSAHQDMNRQDGSQINLDFLDNIESSASDLLNFDQVMQGGGTHFPLLDDMEILGK